MSSYFSNINSAESWKQDVPATQKNLQGGQLDPRFRATPEPGGGIWWQRCRMDYELVLRDIT